MSAGRDPRRGRGGCAGGRRAVRLALLLSWAAAAPLRLAGQELVVSPRGPVRTLGEAVRRASPGQRILVRPGVYREPTVIVDRSVEIVGDGEAVLDGEGVRQLMTITADSVTVRGLTFRDVGVSFVDDLAGLATDGARHCVIERNRFQETFFAVYLARTSDCRVSNNLIERVATTESRSGNGIHLWYSKNVTIEGNRVRGHRDGIYFEFVEDSEIRGNVSEGNLRYGLHFMFSDRCRYRGNTFRDNGAGVAVMYTKHVEMTDNRFLRNWGSASFGLLLKEITDSEIRGNDFVENTVGVYVEGTNRVRVEDNDFRRNGWAVKIMANAEDNLFTGNRFVGNTFDVATNSRMSYSAFRGNFWDQYRGYDLDRDGIGDVPYHPVRLFSLLAERNPPGLILLRSLFVELLDAAERVLPTLTPETLVDDRPRMRMAP